MTDLIASLPHAGTFSNATERNRLQANPIRTLGELWRLFITCGFSSQEDSEEGSALDLFIKAEGPLLDLAYVRKMSCDADWVLTEIRRYVPRMAENKRRLVLGNYALFDATGGAPTAPLADLRTKDEALALFCRLARGDIDDHALERSEEFSARLDSKPYPRIGNKQLRNILANSGLAHNVVPLDLRWKRFFGQTLALSNEILADRAHYCVIENVLRHALLSISASRPDIANLAVLDAMVFQHMSRKGMNNGGWAGAGQAGDNGGDGDDLDSDADQIAATDDEPDIFAVGPLSGAVFAQ